MKQCPACSKWTLDFDDYFGRYRCFNPECGWMPVSSVERQIRLLRSGQEPQELYAEPLAELGLTVRAFYDSVNDALLFDFGLDEPAFEVPEGDGRIVWKIGRQTGSVAGFAILGAREFGVAKVDVDIDARKESIERSQRRVPRALACGRPTRVLIESVSVTAHEEQERPQPGHHQIDDLFQRAIGEFERRFYQIGSSLDEAATV